MEQLEERWFRPWSADRRDETDASAAERAADALEARGDRWARHALAEANGSSAAHHMLKRGWQEFLSSKDEYRRDDLSAAESRARQALDAFVAADSVGRWPVEVELATVAYRRRDLSAASHRLNAVLDASRQHGYRALHARAEWLLGMIAWQRLRPGEALTRTEAALGVLESSGDREKAAQVARVRADHLRNLGLHDQAWRLLTHARAETRESTHALNRYLLYFEASEFAEQLEQIFAADWLQGIAVTAARDTGLPAAVAEARIRRARLQGLLGQREAAVAELQSVQQALDRSPDEYLQASVDHAVGLLAPPSEGLRALHRAIAAHERLEPNSVPFLRLARAQAYRAIGNRDAAERDLNDAMAHAERLSAQLVGRGDSVPAFDTYYPVYAEAIDLALSDGGDAVSALELNERFHSRALEELLGDRSDVNIRATQASLPADAFALVTASLPGRLALWVVTRDRVRVVEHRVSRPVVQTSVDGLMDAIKGGRSVALAARDLRRWLIEPIAFEVTRYKALVLVPDDLLARVPFQFLVTSGEPGERSALDVVYAPSLSVWKRAANEVRLRGAQPALSMLVVTNPRVAQIFGSARRPLPSAQFDVPTMAAAGRTELRGDAATSGAIVAALPHHDVFHFSGHAIGAFTRAALAGLLVSPSGQDGGLLTTDAVRRLELGRLRLVVLAGCSTSAGPVSSSEGPQSVAWGFLAAGVPSIVATLWDVDDASTAAFMAAFYAALPTRGAVSAVSYAQQTLRASANPRFAAPSAWAGFIVLGA
jgi:CHAT domain-containing protein